MFLSLTLALLAAASPPTESFALVVTNNRSLNTARADLRYADDDGVAYAKLFDELFGDKHTVLLTQLDPDTRALAPGLSGTPSASLKNLSEAVQTLSASVAAASARGSKTELFIVFAAHGDVADGAGYLELADGRLSAEGLEQLVIKPLASATRLHLIIDSCNSYFMLNPRKPSGRRWSAEGVATNPLSARYPHLGTFISTNAEAESYEWSELQSGIFSYEVRSGLRGAADADADGHVSYQELAAFIEQANREIPNAQYRPRVAWSAPGTLKAAPLVELARTTSRTIVSSGEVSRHFIIRDRYGVRLADVHQEAGTKVTLVVPDEPHALGLFIAIPGNPRPTWAYREIPPSFRGDIDSLVSGTAPTGARGEAPVFDSLFSKPFGRKAFDQFVASAQPATEPVFGVTRDDVQKLDMHLQNLIEDDREMRVLTASFSDQASWAIFESVRVTDASLLLRRLRSYDLSSDEARARALATTERDFASIAANSKNTRLTLSVLGLIAGTSMVVGGFAHGEQNKNYDPTALFLITGGLLLDLIAARALLWPTVVESEWESWDRSATARSAAPPPPARVSLSLSPSGIGLAGTF